MHKSSAHSNEAAGHSSLHHELRKKSPGRFWGLLFVISSPFYLLGALTETQLLPGLPVSSLMILAPLASALLLVYWAQQGAGVRELLKRALDWRRIHNKRWYVPTLLLMPGVMCLEFVILRWLGSSIPAPQFSASTVLALSIAMFIAAVAEELGWSGYAIEPLQARAGALAAAILLRVIWAIWHFIPLLQAGRATGWIAWWALATVAQRVIIVWLYNNTGQSVFAAALFHMTANLSWQLFPINGSYYDPRITSLLLMLIAAVVVVVWGPSTLARERWGGAR